MWLDLAAGHVKAIQKLETAKGVMIYNLGTGIGYSVLDVVKAYEKACGKKIPYQIKPSVPAIFLPAMQTPQKPKKNWLGRPKRGIEEMCRDSWKWQSMNPDGYR